LLAAHRGGIKTVLIPEANEKDLVDIPANIKKDLEIHPVKWIDQVLNYALETAPKPLEEVAEALTTVAKEVTEDLNPLTTH
jgi:ATP-dependent Lon protease